MKNLKQLLTERKYLEVKTTVMDDRENLEESIDVMLEMIEDARTTVVKIRPVATPMSDEDKDLLERIKEAAPSPWNIKIQGEKWVEHPEGGMCKESSLSKGYKIKNESSSTLSDSYFSSELADGIVETPDGYNWWPDETVLKILDLKNVSGAGHTINHEMGWITFEVAGGDKQEIAQVIHEYKQQGIEAKGNWTEAVQMRYGSHQISFDYIEPPPIADIKVICSFDIEERDEIIKRQMFNESLDLDKPSELEEA